MTYGKINRISILLFFIINAWKFKNWNLFYRWIKYLSIPLPLYLGGCWLFTASVKHNERHNARTLHCISPMWLLPVLSIVQYYILHGNIAEFTLIFIYPFFHPLSSTGTSPSYHRTRGGVQTTLWSKANRERQTSKDTFTPSCPQFI